MELIQMLPKGSIAAILVGIALAALVFETFRQKSEHGKAPLPPSASGAWPIIGHLPCLGGSQLPHVTLAQWADKLGPVFSMNLGVHRALVISSSDLAKECFTTQDMILANRPRLAAFEILGYNYALLGLASYGQYWQRVRKITITEFLSNHRVNALKHVRESVLQKFLKELYDTCKGDGGTVVDMKSWLNTVTYNVVFKMVVGKSFIGIDEGGGKDDEKFKRALTSMMELLGAFVLGDAVPYLKWWDLEGYKKAMKRTARDLDEVLDGWLREHKEKRRQEMSPGQAEDFMDVMISSLDEVDESLGYDADTVTKATSLALILGGTDTTTGTITWALSLLLNKPDALVKARAEIDLHIGTKRQVSDSDLKNLTYLHAVIKETLRLYPAAPLNITHLSSMDCTIGGYHVAAGTQVIANLWKLHRDPAVWSDPEEFMPERFLTTQKNVDLKGQNFEYLPFGSGRRICPGIPFALQVSLLVLASLIQGFEMKTPKEEKVDMTMGFGLNCPKATPLDVILKVRGRGTEL